MRPVNLLPPEQRSRAASGASRIGPAHVVIGLLGVLLLCVVGYVLAANSVTSKQDKLAELDRQTKQVESQAAALKPYGDFAALKEARVDTVKTLAASRFDWEHVVRQFSQVVPYNVWLIKFTAKSDPSVQLSEGTGGGGASTAATGSSQAAGPAVEITGCTYEQRSVARMMVRMRRMDGVTDVKLISSKKPDNQDEAGSATTTSGSSDLNDCPATKADRITKFDIVVEFDPAKLTQSLALGLGAPTPAVASGAQGTPGAAAAPSGQAPPSGSGTSSTQAQPASTGGSGGTP